MIDVSIIIPVYNSERYLEECVRSLVAQTLKSIEIILVDDGSTDHSIEIEKKLEKEFNNVVIIEQINAGPGCARNRGIKEAKGQYIYFIDSDDYLGKNELITLFDFGKKHNLDSVIGGYTRVDTEKNILYRERYKNTIFRKDEVKEKLLPKIIGSSPLGHDNMRVTIWNVLFKRKVLLTYDISFLAIKSEDTIFNIDFYTHANMVGIIDTIGYFYRENITSMTSSTYKQNLFIDSKASYLVQKKKLKSANIFEKNRDRLSRQFFIDVRESLLRELPMISHKSKTQALQAMKEIISDPLLMSILEIYPINKLELEQKLFLKIIKNGNEWIVYYLIKMYRMKQLHKNGK